MPVTPDLNSLYMLPSGGCNLGCSHCWVAARRSDLGFETRPPAAGELAPEEIEDIGRQARDMGAQVLKLTGTEPLLRSDSADIYRRLAALGLFISIETNGTLRPPGLLEEFRLNPPAQISVSLDSADPAEHDAFRRAGGSHRRATQLIGLLTDMDVNTQIIMSVEEYSTSAVTAMARLGEELGAAGLKINPVVPVGRGAGSGGAAYMVRKRLEFTRWVFDSLGPGVDISTPPAFKTISRLLFESSCNVLNLVGVLSDGRTSFCGMGLSRPELVFGDLRKQTLREIWNRSTLLDRLREEVPHNLKGVCGRCIHRTACLGHCVMNNYVAGGSFSSPNPLCQGALELGLFPKSRLLDG